MTGQFSSKLGGLKLPTFIVTLFLLASAQLALGQVIEHTEARSFVTDAVQTELSSLGLSQTTRDLLLLTDEEGHPLSFIPDCPVCLGVQDALAKVETTEVDRDVPEAWSVPKASTRTSAFARFVKQAVQNKLLTIEDMGERLDMNKKLKLASDEGQRQLARYQTRKVKAYKMMWSCLMCDSASKAGEL